MRDQMRSLRRRGPQRGGLALRGSEDEMEATNRVPEKIDRPVRYEGDAFAPPARAYIAADMRSFPFSTLADSGHAPSATIRVAELGALAPLALAALWESA